MMNYPTIVRRVVEIADPLGLQMRPATHFAEVARRFIAEIRVRCNGAEADDKSILALLSLTAGGGMMLDLEANGSDAEQAVADLVALISAPPR